MAKKKTVYLCQECGYDSPKWLGKCPGCGQWNTMVEEIIKTEIHNKGLNLGLTSGSFPVPISSVEIQDLPRFFIRLRRARSRTRRGRYSGIIGVDCR